MVRSSGCSGVQAKQRSGGVAARPSCHRAAARPGPQGPAIAGGVPYHRRIEPPPVRLVLSILSAAILRKRWRDKETTEMRIELTSVFVDDQDKALAFYTEVLGFEKKVDIPMGGPRWLTVVSPENPDGTQLVLEPDSHPAAKPFKQALVADGIPLTSFGVDDVEAEFERLRALGVEFHKEPTVMGPVTIAIFHDTCGNLIQIHRQ